VICTVAPVQTVSPVRLVNYAALTMSPAAPRDATRHAPRAPEVHAWRHVQVLEWNAGRKDGKAVVRGHRRSRAHDRSKSALAKLIHAPCFHVRNTMVSETELKIAEFKKNQPLILSQFVFKVTVSYMEVLQSDLSTMF